MNKIKIITDSTCDLSKELVEKLNIDVIPLYVIFGEQEYKDGVEITTKELYKKVEELGTLPRTSAAAPADFVKIFDKYLDEGYDIIYTGIGASVSGTFQSARVAKDTVDADNILLIDSKNLSTGTGLLVLKLAQLVSEGKTLEEIKVIAENEIDRIGIFVLDFTV